MTTPEPEDTELPQIVNLSQVKVDTVQAGLARVSQSFIQHLSTDEVDLQTSMVGAIQTGELNVRDSIMGTAVIHEASIQESLSGGIRADTLTFDGAAVVVLANSMSNKDVRAVAVVGTNVQADSIRTGFLISREVHGNVTTTLDGRTAMLAGLVGGAVTGLILLVGKLLIRRKN